MLTAFLLPILLQLSPPEEGFYEPEFSDAAIEIFDRRDELSSEELVRLLDQLARNGDDSALEILGEIYSFGLTGIERDPVRACDYFERQERRRPDGLHNLATCYYSGNGREQDHALARELYAAAAQGRWIMAYCAYGNMLVRGQGGPVDAEQGLALCKMTAAAGDADAQTDYGTYLLTGEGVERDPVTARFMLELAGRQGQANAASLLGQIHMRGDGTPVDYATASEWFETAYRAGRADAAYDNAMALARMGFRKEGDDSVVIAEHLSEAISWFEIAAEVDPSEEKRARSLEMIENSRRLIAASQR